MTRMHPSGQNRSFALPQARIGRTRTAEEWSDTHRLARYAAAHGLAAIVSSQTRMYETQQRLQ